MRESITATNDLAYFPGKSYGPGVAKESEKCPPASTDTKTKCPKGLTPLVWHYVCNRLIALCF